MQNIRIENSGCAGLWMAGWLFTIGYFQFSFWKSVLALFIWPYYIGVEAAKRIAK